MKEIQETYPEQSFKSVGVTFSPGVPYLEKIKEETKDLDINIVFNNDMQDLSLLDSWIRHPSGNSSRTWSAMRRQRSISHTTLSNLWSRTNARDASSTLPAWLDSFPLPLRQCMLLPSHLSPRWHPVCTSKFKALELTFVQCIPHQ